MALEGMAASASGLFMTVFRVIIWIVVIAICFLVLDTSLKEETI